MILTYVLISNSAILNFLFHNDIKFLEDKLG